MYSAWPTDTPSPKDQQTEEQNPEDRVVSGSSTANPGSAMPVSKHRQPRRPLIQPRVVRPAGRENDASREPLRTTILEIVDSQCGARFYPERCCTKRVRDF